MISCMTALNIENLGKSYSGKAVVRDFSLTVQPGEILGLLGPNGAGKSTTINMIAGVTKVESGKISVFGFDNQKDYITTRRLVGVMHQEIVVDQFFNIEDALKIHAGYYGVPDDPAWRANLVDRLALGPHLKKGMNKLSGGMKRRFMVAKALIHKPSLLILDEPTAGVDVELRQNLWDFVREMNKNEGTTILLTTHYLEEAEQMCQRIAIMNQGALIACDRKDILINQLDEKRMIVHLEQKLERIPEAIASMPVKLKEDGLSLSFQVSKKNSATEIVRALAGLNLPLKEIESSKPNLQEVFLKLTRAH